MSTLSKLTLLIPTVYLSLCLAGCSMAANDAKYPTPAHQANTAIADHIGPITSNELLAHYDIFANNKKTDQTVISDEKINDLARHLDHKKITAIFGTWCGDSQREIPRLLNLLEQVRQRHPEVVIDTQLIAVAHSDKRDPAVVKQYRITAVPTIILFDHDNEMGRIIEQTQLNLADDLLVMKL